MRIRVKLLRSILFTGVERVKLYSQNYSQDLLETIFSGSFHESTPHAILKVERNFEKKFTTKLGLSSLPLEMVIYCSVCRAKIQYFIQCPLVVYFLNIFLYLFVPLLNKKDII